MTDVIVREASSEDLPAMAELMESLPEWFTKDAVEEVRGLCPASPGLVGVDEAGATAGFLLWERRGEECEIKWIAVARERHRQGIGRMLVARLLELMAAIGLHRICAATVAPTVEYDPYARTRAFYEACGFRLETVEAHGWPDGTDKALYVLEQR